MEQNLTLNQNGMLGVDTTYDDPEPSFGYTTTIKGSVPLPECKSIYISLYLPHQNFTVYKSNIIQAHFL